MISQYTILSLLVGEKGKMNYKPVAIIIIVWGLFCTGYTYAGGAIWLGNLDPLDNNWTTGTNWEHGLPTSSDPAYIT